MILAIRNFMGFIRSIS